jgi:hypothetical protein
MNDILLAALIVIAILCGQFTELFFKKVWPLIELAIRRRLDLPDQRP